MASFYNVHPVFLHFQNDALPSPFFSRGILLQMCLWVHMYASTSHTNRVCVITARVCSRTSNCVFMHAEVTLFRKPSSPMLPFFFPFLTFLLFLHLMIYTSTYIKRW